MSHLHFLQDVLLLVLDGEQFLRQLRDDGALKKYIKKQLKNSNFFSDDGALGTSRTFLTKGTCILFLHVYNNSNKVYFIAMDILQLITNRQTIHKKYPTEDMRKIITP